MDNRERDMGAKSRWPPHAAACLRTGPPDCSPRSLLRLHHISMEVLTTHPFLMVSAHFVIFCPGCTRRVHGAGTPGRGGEAQLVPAGHKLEVGQGGALPARKWAGPGPLTRRRLSRAISYLGGTV